MRSDGLSSLTTFSPGQTRLRHQKTQRYWQRTGGTLLEKYCVAPASRGIHGRQVVDAIIIESSGRRIASQAEHGSLRSLLGRLTMPLLSAIDQIVSVAADLRP